MNRQLNSKSLVAFQSRLRAEEMELNNLAQAVSLSLQRLQTARSDDTWATVSFQPTPTRRFQAPRFRELASIPENLRECLKLAEIGKVQWPIYIHGDPGNGKTCASLAISDHVDRSEFFTFEQFAAKTNDIRFGRSFFTAGGQMNPEGYREITHEIAWTVQRWNQHLVSVPLVLLDDVGTRDRASEAAYEAFKGLLDSRDGKPLIVTSNHDVSVMATIFDPRVFDRLASGTVVKLTESSRR